MVDEMVKRQLTECQEQPRCVEQEIIDILHGLTKDEFIIMDQLLVFSPTSPMADETNYDVGKSITKAVICSSSAINKTNPEIYCSRKCNNDLLIFMPQKILR